MDLLHDLIDPPREFSVMPFWFWNDDLDEEEIVRQIRDFEEHGVYGFIIHPRVGLPRELGWMSDRLLDLYAVAIEEAERRGMYVGLYDEGMYPSGSSSGQVVAENPAFACRCLAPTEVPSDGEPELKEGESLVAVVSRQNGARLAIVDRPADSYIRGIHYIDGGPAEDEPPAADLLNPEAVATFLRLVYQKFADRFSDYFGNTIFSIFTDEPGLLGKCRERGVAPGTTGILVHVNRILGYDFTPHLPALWHADEPDAERCRQDYHQAVRLRLEETYYRSLYEWCDRNGLPLTGHPSKPDDIGMLRHFHIPGQDTVWRWVLPDDPTALEGPESTQAKCSSSAMIHGQRRRNSNECCGAYGHELTWEEMVWLANWCFVRGVNLLYPHAFYYSVRGARRDERPPDVGPNSTWWDRYGGYADACRRLSWINTDSEHICSLAVLGTFDQLPWRSAKACYQNQRDFNYLEERDLIDRATIDDEGIHLAGMNYRALIFEHEPDAAALAALEPLERSGKVIRWTDADSVGSLAERIDAVVPPDLRVTPAISSLRVRHVRKENLHYYLLFNEEREPVTAMVEPSICGNGCLFDPGTGGTSEWSPDSQMCLSGHELRLIVIGEHGG